MSKIMTLSEIIGIFSFRSPRPPQELAFNSLPNYSETVVKLNGSFDYTPVLMGVIGLHRIAVCPVEFRQFIPIGMGVTNAYINSVLTLTLCGPASRRSDKVSAF